MSNVLRMAALQLCDPVILLVLMESYDPLGDRRVRFWF